MGTEFVAEFAKELKVNPLAPLLYTNVLILLGFAIGALVRKWRSSR